MLYLQSEAYAWPLHFTPSVCHTLILTLALSTNFCQKLKLSKTRLPGLFSNQLQSIQIIAHKNRHTFSLKSIHANPLSRPNVWVRHSFQFDQNFKISDFRPNAAPRCFNMPWPFDLKRVSIDSPTLPCKAKGMRTPRFSPIAGMAHRFWPARQVSSNTCEVSHPSAHSSCVATTWPFPLSYS